MGIGNLFGNIGGSLGFTNNALQNEAYSQLAALQNQSFSGWTTITNGTSASSDTITLAPYYSALPAPKPRSNVDWLDEAVNAYRVPLAA